MFLKGPVCIPLMTCAVESADCVSLERTRESAYARFQVNQNRSRYVSSIVALVEEYVLPVATFGCKVFEVTILADPVFLTELLPELAADWMLSVSWWNRR